MNIDDAFPGKYLKAADLKGRQQEVVIERLEIGDEDVEHKPVLYFEGRKLGLALNVTNKETLKALFDTPNTDEWIGQTIVIYPTKVLFQTKMVDAIRIMPPKAPETVRTVKPRAMTENPADGMSDEVPF